MVFDLPAREIVLSTPGRTKGLWCLNSHKYFGLNIHAAGNKWNPSYVSVFEKFKINDMYSDLNLSVQISSALVMISTRFSFFSWCFLIWFVVFARRNRVSHRILSARAFDIISRITERLSIILKQYLQSKRLTIPANHL